MAKNLRTKLPKDDTLFIHDVNKGATEKFGNELSDFDVVVANNPREVAEKSVSRTLFFFEFNLIPMMSTFVLSMTKLGSCIL